MAETRFIFLGAGNMAEAMVRGLISEGNVQPSEILLCDLRQERLDELKVSLGVQIEKSAAKAMASPGTLVLAVKPQGLQKLAEEIREKIDSQRLIISILAGVTLRALQKSLGERGLLVRVMPNTPALVGQGASAYALGAGAGEAQVRQVETLLGSFGIVVQVKEAQINAVTALSGSGPAYVFLFMEALQTAAQDLGLDKAIAFKLAAQTLTGAAAMIQNGQDSPQALREKVTSPGGTTAAALKVFEEQDFRGIVKAALLAARNRGEELGKE